MKDFIGGQLAVTDADLIELSIGAGTPLELWLDEANEGESPEERAARLDAARDILADDPELIDRVTRMAVQAVEVRAPELLNVIPLTRRPAARRTVRGVAA